MKKFKFQKQIESLKKSDFLEGTFDSWQIWIQDSEFSLPRHYMQCGFDSEKQANNEMIRIINRYSKIGKGIYKIEVVKTKVMRLKNPISVS
jgi:hypothetical protein